jgi:hypothetical protein
MDARDELDDLTDDERVADHRARAAAELDQITQQVKLALIERGIDMPVFFIIPHSGDVIVTFGTITDPPDDEWNHLSEIVTAIVRQSVGLDRTRCRHVLCAATHSIADHQPAPMSTPALQHAGAE